MSRLRDAIAWLEVRFNRPLLPARPDAEFWSLFAADGRPLAGPPATLTAAQGTSLLVVLTTFNRPEGCGRILAALPDLLAHAGRPLRAHVIVVKDAGGADYSEVQAAAQAQLGGRLTWLEARERLGKQQFWKTYHTLLLAARALQPDHALFLQDDLEFAPTLLAECYARFAALGSDPLRRVLYLFASGDDEPEGRWVAFRRREAGPGLRLTQWFDLQAFFVDRVFFELLRYRMIPVSPRRWIKKPYSSGVGEQLTRRMFRVAHVYQTMPSLVFHGSHPSEMNPEARAERSLDNRGPGSSAGA